MKTNKNTILGPELFVDGHHGIYMGKLAYEYLAEEYKKQALKKLGKETIDEILDMDHENHHEAVDEFTRIQFKRPTGQKFTINFAEGGMWVIPNCFWRTKEADSFFGC